jgi:hypothetical protein
MKVTSTIILVDNTTSIVISNIIKVRTTTCPLSMIKNDETIILHKTRMSPVHPIEDLGCPLDNEARNDKILTTRLLLHEAG